MCESDIGYIVAKLDFSNSKGSGSDFFENNCLLLAYVPNSLGMMFRGSLEKNRPSTI